MAGTIKDLIESDMAALAKATQAAEKPKVEEMIKKIIKSKKFGTGPRSQQKPGDIQVGKMTTRQKALFAIFDNSQNDNNVRKCAYKMFLGDVQKDKRVQSVSKSSGKDGLAMCAGFMITLF